MTDAEPERVDVAPHGLVWTERLAPYAQHGPLPLVLLGLTVVTGVVDAVSYIALGHVFVGNMTGNIVLLGFALAGAPGLSVAASLTAIAAFLAGAVLGGALGRRIPGHRGAFARTGIAAEVALLAVAFVVALGADDPITGARRYAVIVVLAIALGGQNAVARRIAVPDLTTTVVTLTLTALAADARLAGGPGDASARRIAAVVAMFLGALAGGLLTVHVSAAAALALATATAGGVALGAHRTVRSRAGWALRGP
jgi:uncharacterized membrane protein YoaK (UPF0700 family)